MSERIELNIRPVGEVTDSLPVVTVDFGKDYGQVLAVGSIGSADRARVVCIVAPTRPTILHITPRRRPKANLPKLTIRPR